MSLRWSIWVLLLTCTACSTLPQLGVSPGDAARADRQIVVTVHQGQALSNALLGAPEGRYQRRRGYQAAPSVERVLEQLAREHELTRIDGWPIASLDVYCEVFEVRPGTSVDALLERLSNDPRVSLAQRMNLFETLASRYDDTYAELQTATLQLDVESAHRVATGRGITVAVIDSGVDTRHPEFRGRVDIVRDFVASAPMPREGEVHGTAVAGVIASSANNAEGIVGIAPDVSVAALRACWSESQDASKALCSTYSLAQALEAALSLSPNVINMSLTGPHDPLLAQLLERIVERGIIVVTVRPEQPDWNGAFPASQRGILVAQSSSAGWDLSSPNLLVAPAEEILTTTPASSYAFFSGGSLAAAHVSGIVALLVEKQPRIPSSEIASLLKDTSTMDVGRESVNACRALLMLTGSGVCVSGDEAISVAGQSHTTN